MTTLWKFYHYTTTFVADDSEVDSSEFCQVGVVSPHSMLGGAAAVPGGARPGGLPSPPPALVVLPANRAPSAQRVHEHLDPRTGSCTVAR